MKHLTYLAGRRRPWTEHNCFPKKAIERAAGDGSSAGVIMVFRLSEDRKTIAFVPEEEWEL